MNKLLTLLALLAMAGPLAAQTAAPTLIPFQGRLTDQNGVAYTNNQYTIVFQLYDQAVGGTLLWSERHEKVGVVNGMVNVFLGSIATLTNVTFSSTRYLGITVDGDNNPNTPDPEMVPRQMIIPAFFAKKAALAEDSAKLGGYDWTPLFGVNNPSGTFPGSKIAAASLPASVFAAGTVPGTVLVPATIGASQLADGAVTPIKLPARIIGTNAPLGGIAASTPIRAASPAGGVDVDSRIPVEVASIGIQTTGRPMLIMLVPHSLDGGWTASYLEFSQPPGTQAEFGLYRNGTKQFMVINRMDSSQSFPLVPPSRVMFFDTPPAGTHTYSLRISSSVNRVSIINCRLIAFEL